MGNILQFSLGLETAEWLHGLTESSAKVIEFLGVVEGSERVLDQFIPTRSRKAARFFKILCPAHLHRFALSTRRAFKSVGVDQNEVEVCVHSACSAPAGLNDAGNRTEFFFATTRLANARPARSIRSTDPLGHECPRQTQSDEANRRRRGFVRARPGRAALQIARQAEQFRDAFARSAFRTPPSKNSAACSANCSPPSARSARTFPPGSPKRPRALSGRCNTALICSNQSLGIKSGSRLPSLAIAFSLLTVKANFRNSLPMPSGPGWKLAKSISLPFFSRFVIEFDNVCNLLTVSFAEALLRPIALVGAEFDKYIERLKQLDPVNVAAKITGLPGYKPHYQRCRH